MLLRQVLLLVLPFVVAAVTTAVPLESYTDKYDHLDVDEILGNERLYRKYFECLIGKGKCTPDGKELRDRLPEALATGCAKCTPRQKMGSDKVLRYVIEKRPEDWLALEKTFDPVGVYRRRYRDEVLKKGIHLELVTDEPLPATTTLGDMEGQTTTAGES